MSTMKRSFFILTMFFLSVFWGAWACKTLAEEPTVSETVPEISRSYTGRTSGSIM